MAPLLALKCQTGRLAASRRTDTAPIAALPRAHSHHVAPAAPSLRPPRHTTTLHRTATDSPTTVARFKTTASDAESRADASQVASIARNIVLIVDESEVCCVRFL